MNPVEALQAALAAEHAAIYGYGALGARLTGSAQDTARLVLDAHRNRRDKLTAHIGELGAQPVAAGGAYRLPVKVDSARTAAELAAVLEERLMTAYLGLTGVRDAKLRRYGALAMQEAMTRSVAWRGAAGEPAEHAPAFPGLPQSALTPRPEQ